MTGATPTLRSDRAAEQPTGSRPEARRARRQAVRRQAVMRRRRPFRWSEDATRLTAGLALLLVIVLVVSGPDLIESWLRRDGGSANSTAADTVPPDPASSTPQASASAPVDIEPTEEGIPSGPEVTHQLLEANGPTLGCSYPPRLAAFRSKIGPSLVGECVEDALFAADADATQRTTNGKLIWRRADERAAFTDGADTWLDGPNGIVRRHSHERYAWEPDEAAGPRPAKTMLVLPPPLPGALLPARRLVSFYGNPLSSTMGILGELPPDQLFKRLRSVVAAYADADRSRPVLPALELVAVVAQPEPGPDGLYRLRMDPALIEQVAGWAEQNDSVLILDVQAGQGDVDAEIQWLLPFLKRPNVHLALDPEFTMPSGQVPGKRIGTMDGAIVNRAIRTVAELVTAEQLPPKLLIVHRFTEEMVTNPQAITTDPRVQVVVVMDGFGTPSVKTRQYDELIVDQRVEHTGIKLFFHHDEPQMTPAQTLQLDPPPDLIIYQ